MGLGLVLVERRLMLGAGLDQLNSCRYLGGL